MSEVLKVVLGAARPNDETAPAPKGRRGRSMA